MSLTTIILAAGKSTRMLSLKSKILFKISAEPIIQHVYNAAKKIKSNDVVCVAVSYTHLTLPTKA